MTPKLNLRYKQYIFKFYSHEESRPHIHVTRSGETAEAKFWINKDSVELASNKARFSNHELNEISQFLEANSDFILAEWMRFFNM